ncbi:MAG: hypothetical protein ACYTFA_04100 [Planctomycetota bacterium]|jgi:hypothetical protein
MFNYDWFHGEAFQGQKEEAKRRCLAVRFPDVDREAYERDEQVVKFGSELETRMLIYLRDGFSYEVKQIAEVGSKSHLVFECEPIDEQYKVGAFVVTVPFEEIVRVELFVVHPNEKPVDWPQITGFRGYKEPGEQKYPDGKPPIHGLHPDEQP